MRKKRPAKTGFEDLKKQIAADTKAKRHQIKVNADKAINDIFEDVVREIKLPKRATQPRERTYSTREMKLVAQLWALRVATGMMTLWVAALLLRG